MGIGGVDPLGVLELHEAQKLEGAPSRLAAGKAEMALERLGDLPPEGNRRVQRGARVLIDHG